MLSLHFKERKVVFYSGHVERRNYCLDVWNSFQQMVLFCQYYWYCSHIGIYLFTQQAFC